MYRDDYNDNANVIIHLPDGVLGLQAEEEARGEVMDVVHTVDMIFSFGVCCQQITWRQ